MNSEVVLKSCVHDYILVFECFFLWCACACACVRVFVFEENVWLGTRLRHRGFVAVCARCVCALAPQRRETINIYALRLRSRRERSLVYIDTG